MIECQNISLATNGKVILKYVDFKAHKGGITVLMGKNGSGKTSLLRCISGAYAGYGGKLSSGDKEKVLLSMERAGILPHKNDMVCNLSGGERQIAFFAMLLAQDTPVVLLDVNCSNPLGCVFCVSSIEKEMGVTAYTKER